jgi:hypothetical protein
MEVQMKCRTCGQELPKEDERLPSEFYVLIRKKKIGFKTKDPNVLHRYYTLQFIYTDLDDAKRVYQARVFRVRLGDEISQNEEG